MVSVTGTPLSVVSTVIFVRDLQASFHHVLACSEPVSSMTRAISATSRADARSQDVGCEDMVFMKKSWSWVSVLGGSSSELSKESEGHEKGVGHDGSLGNLGYADIHRTVEIFEHPES